MRRSWQLEDNFRVLASCDSKFLNDAVNLDRDLQPPPGQTAPYHGLEIRIARATGAPLTLLPEHTSWQSEVLTVWRRLHIERDSMAAPGNANTVNGQITNVAAGPGAEESTVTTNQNLADQDQYQCPPGRYPTPCQLNTGGRPYNTRSNTMGANAIVTVSLRDVQNNLQPAPTANQAFTLHDDDDDAVLPHLPDLVWMQDSDNPAQNLYVWAYIRPRASGTSQQNVTFALNIDTRSNGPILQQLNAGRYAAARNNNQPDFWIAYVQAAFQPWLDDDGDPDWPPPSGENIILGICPGTCIRGGDNGTLIFQETVSDWQQTAARLIQQQNPQLIPRPRQDFERGTVVHEIGHQFACPDVSLANPSDIMGGRWLLTDTTVIVRFFDPCLNLIRSVERPGGRT